MVEATEKSMAERTQDNEPRSDTREPIAIVSIACRLPGGVDDPESYWRVLDEGLDVIGPFPPERWNARELYSPDPEAEGKTYCTQGGFVRGADRFDAEFFGIAPREAVEMDPAHRLALECVWEALERARLRPADLRQTQTGVYLGTVYSDYEPWGGTRGMAGMSGYGFTGRDGSVLSGRISYTLDLQGPAVTINTACSSSLVAVHLACNALYSGECSMAIAGGSQVMATPGTFVEFSRLRALARDGRCKSFSDDGGGTGWAEGCGVLVLQRLSDALRDKRPILALVRATAINQDGRSQGLTAPNGRAQERVIRRALAQAGLTSGDVDVLEAHGTGTALGDPIEAGALSAVFGPGRPKDRPLYLGSAKSNLGHTQTASGVAGVIKMVLALENQKLPRSLHSAKPSRRIHWEGSGLALLQEERDWPRGERVRRAGINSFGISGTNAHMILEEAPLIEAESGEPAAGGEPLPMMPLLVSGMDTAALRAQAARLADHLDRHPDISAADLAFSLATTRTHFPARLAMSVPRDGRAADIAASLRAFVDGNAPVGLHSDVVAHRPGKRVVLFPGQGSQRPGMGKQLHESLPAFREALDAICAELDPKLRRPLLDVMFAPPDSEAARLLDQTEFTQPALFALEVALYRQWERWGLVPDLLVGHSIGELAAAHVAGVLSLADACALVAARGRLMQSAPAGGAMFSIGARDSVVAELLAGMEDCLAIAAINDPEQTVISGDAAAAEGVARELQAQGKKVHRLRVSHAFHSPHMNGILEEYRRVAQTLTYHAPRIPVLSNLTGKLVSEEQMCSPAYWVRQLRGAVRFRDCIRNAEAAGADRYVECGPRGALSAMAANTTTSAKSTFIASLRDGREEDSLMDAVGRAHVAGMTFDWSAVLAGAGARRIALPTYSFQRKSYWLGGPQREEKNAESLGLRHVAHAMLGAEIALPEGGFLFTARVSRSDVPWLPDHAIFDRIILPGMSLLDMLATAGRRVGAPQIRRMSLQAPLIVPRDGAALVQITLDPADTNGQRAFRVHARAVEAGTEGPWTLHASGALEAETAISGDRELAVWPPPGSTPVELDGFYERLAARGLQYGPAFRALREAHRHGADVYGTLELPAGQDTAGYRIHPALLDAGLHLLFAGAQAGTTDVLVPFELQHARMADIAAPPREVRAHLVLGGTDASGLPSRASISFHDTNGVLLAAVTRADFRSISPDKLKKAADLEAAARTAKAAPAPIFRPASAATLLRVQWTPVPLAASLPSRAACAVVGSGAGTDEITALLRTSGVDVVRVDTPAELRERLAREPRRVSTVVRVVNAPSGGDIADSATRMTADMVKELQDWTRQRELAAYRHVLVTSEAILPGRRAMESLACAPLWGLLRSVRSENPERQWMLLDTDGDEASQQAFAAALFTAGEPEAALRRGTLLVPRWVQADVPAAAPRSALSPQGTVLVTGATSGLGPKVAKHLATHHGVKHLLLTSRRGQAAPGASELTRELAALGCEAVMAACDVADEAALAELLGTIPDEHPLTGVFHSAGVLDGGLAMSLTSDNIARVFGPKVKGAWNLHQLTQDRALAEFVVFSSVAGLVGSEGQGAYAAANTFLDCLSQARHQLGLPAQSLAWGPWAEVGMASRLPEVHQDRMRRAGFISMPPAEALEEMSRAMRVHEPLLVPVHLDEEALRREPPRPWLRSLFPDRAPEPAPVIEQVTKPQTLRQRLDAATPQERESTILELVRTEVAAVLKLQDAKKLQVDQPLEQLGMDSLMAVDIRRRLENRLSMQLPATLVFDHPTCGALLDHLLTYWTKPAATTTAGGSAPLPARTL